jgi:hypothetical protein
LDKLAGKEGREGVIIPADAIIAVERVRDYLLMPLKANDKSGYLALAGYRGGDFWELIRDIRQQLLSCGSE